MRFFDIYQNKTSFFVVTEHYGGGSLYDKILEQPEKTAKNAKIIMKQLLSAVYYLQNNQIVHKDIKPDNILFTNDKFNLKLIDFGLANFYTNNISMSKSQGTLYFLAPEVLKKNYDYKCDNWSCGVVMYQLLTGQLPYEKCTYVELKKKIYMGELYFDEQVWNSIDPDAQSLLKGLLEKDPQLRISMEDALNHPYFQQQSQRDIDMMPNLIKLQDFNSYNVYKASIMKYIQQQIMANEEQHDMLKLFRKLDVNNDGVISLQEYLDVQKDNGVLTDNQVEQSIKIFEQVDTNKSGRIDYTGNQLQFRISNCKLRKKQIIKIRQLTKSLQTLRQNNTLNKEEILNYICDGDIEQRDELLKFYDLNKDGSIDFKEFILLIDDYIFKKNQEMQSDDDEINVEGLDSQNQQI